MTTGYENLKNKMNLVVDYICDFIKESSKYIDWYTTSNPRKRSELEKELFY